MTDIAIGYANAPETHRDTVAINARTGASSGNMGLHFDIQGRIGEHIAQFGLGAGFSAMSRPLLSNHLLLRGALGVHYLETGVVDDAFSFGMGTPYADFAATWIVSSTIREQAAYMLSACCREPARTYLDGWGLTLAAGIEYDVRFTSAQPNEAVWMVTLGVTWIKDWLIHEETNPPTDIFH